MPFASILGFYSSNLKRLVETQLNREVSDVVLGRPVRFVDKDDAAARRQTDAGRMLARKGSGTSSSVEAIAAALDYEQRISRRNWF